MTREQRRLAAIVALDVVGYSRLMGRDESGTHARLKAIRTERLEPAVARNGGRIVKLTGDGAIVEFGSAVDALRASIEAQQALVEANARQPEDSRIVFRVGLHLGDLIVDGDDLYGDGVNIAARLEAEAPPGGILLSRAMQEAVVGKLAAQFHPVGELALKNIDHPVAAFRVEWQAVDWPAPAAPLPRPAATPLALPDKPSIAVLPFQNMSDDPEQEYFADGMVEDIITGLSRNKLLFVIARNSSFAYKGKSPDIRQVGSELGVRYVLEGSVRKAGNRVRITGQLIDTSNGAHLWADRFDGSLEDIFDLQDQVTIQVMGGILPSLERAEIDRAKRKIGNLRAYDYYLRAWAEVHRYTSESLAEALVLLGKAIELDPGFAQAHAAIATCHFARRAFFWSVDPGADAVDAARAIQRAFTLDPNDAGVLTTYGQVLSFTPGRTAEGVTFLDKVIDGDPNQAAALWWRGIGRHNLGDIEGAIGDFERALRLSPLDPLIWIAQSGLAASHFALGRYGEAASGAASSLRQRPNHPTAHLVGIAAYALTNRLDLARQALDAYRAFVPAARLSSVKAHVLFPRAEDAAKLMEGLRLAGMAE